MEAVTTTKSDSTLIKEHIESSCQNAKYKAIDQNIDLVIERLQSFKLVARAETRENTKV